MTWCAFDLETTGVDVETDRIVTACVGMADPGTWMTRNWLVNPGVEIPQGAIDVHGITNEKAQTGADPAVAVTEIVAALDKAWELGPVVGWNLCYDLSLLDRESKRRLGKPLVVRGPVLDGMVLDKDAEPYRKGSRALAAVAEVYGVPLTEAHTADADAFAALRVTWMIVHQHYDGVSLTDLHSMQIDAYRMQRTSFHAYLMRQGRTPDDDNTVWPVKP